MCWRFSPIRLRCRFAFAGSPLFDELVMRKLFSLLRALSILVFTLAGALNAQVALLGTPTSQLAVSNTLTGVTVAAGSSRLLVVVASDALTNTISSVSFGGAPLVRAVEVTDGSSVSSIWYLALGTSASATNGSVVMSSLGTDRRYIAAAAFSGVRQSVPVIAGPTGQGSGNATRNVTSEGGDLVFDVFDALRNSTAPTTTIGSGQTLVSQGNGSILSDFLAYRTSTKPGAPSTAMSWSSTNTRYLHATINIKQLLLPDLTLASAPIGSTFVRGGSASFEFTATNAGQVSTSASYTVAATMPIGLSAVSANGSGWTCTVQVGGGSFSCTRSIAIAAGLAAPPITLATTIAANAPSTIQLNSSVSGGGESATGNNAATTTLSSIATPVAINVPSGASFSLNAVSYTGTQTVNLLPGTYTLSTSTPQVAGAGTRLVFSNWSDAGAIAHSITVATSPVNITGNFTTQHQLTTAVSGMGTVTPATGTFFDVGTLVNISATASVGWRFVNWTGLVTNPNAAATTVNMNAPKSVTANFTNLQSVTINVPVGVGFRLNNTDYIGSQTVTLASGNYTLSTTTPQSLGSGTRAVFNSWSDGGAISHAISVGVSALTITGNFTTQHQLTMFSGVGGTVTPASGSFFDAGSVVNVSATPSASFVFTGWTGTVANPSAANTTVTLDVPKSLTANFAIAPAVTASPNDLTRREGATATFAASASGTPSPAVQWQVSVDGGGSFTNVPGATSSTLSFTTQLADNGRRYRAVFTNSGGSATTAAAILTINNGGVLNIDNSNATSTYGAATDGLLLIRYLVGFRDAALIADARGSGAALRDASQIALHIQANLVAFDVDGDGETLAHTDGLMILRRLLAPNSAPSDASASAAITANAKNSSRSNEAVVIAIDALKP
jgi:Divergent InlB B-repeat domain